MASNIRKPQPSPQLQDFILTEWGIDKGKMLGITEDGLRLDWGVAGGTIRVELVGEITPEQGERIRELFMR